MATESPAFSSNLLVCSSFVGAPVSLGASSVSSVDDVTSDVQSAPGRAARQPGPCREAIVFMIGGGNYLERAPQLYFSAAACSWLAQPDMPAA